MTYTFTSRWLVIVGVAIGVCRGQGSLGEAWREYEYQNFPTAERLFSLIVKETPPTSDQNVEARVGLAMLVHYRMPGNNPKKAIGLYREILAGLDSNHAFFPTLLVSLGKAYMGINDPDTSAARVCFETVMTRYAGSLEADQAAMETAYRISAVQTEQRFRQAIGFLEDYSGRFPDNLFAGTMLGFCARLNLHMQDYRAAQQYFIRLYESGKITNMYEVPTVLFQIASISEHKLGDYETAKKYYRIIVEKHSIDARLYVCELRLKALEEMTDGR